MIDGDELTFDLDDAAAATLQASQPLRREPDRAAVYFDTPDQTLRKAGLALCIVHSQGTRRQLLTAAAPGVPWQLESVVQGDRPVLDRQLQALFKLEAERLAPVFRIQTTRFVGPVASDASKGSLVLDRGQIFAGDRHADFCEVRLGGAAGEAAELFALARGMQPVATMRLSMRSRAERGYLLLSKAPNKAVKAEPVDLHPGMTTMAAFRQIAFACLRQYRLNEDLLLTQDRPEAVHQARVALRRLRSAFSIFGGLFVVDRARQLRDESRWLAGTLGDARDLDVLIDRADADQSIHDQLQTARKAAYLQLRKTLASARVRMLMLDLAEWLTVCDPPESDQTQTNYAQDRRLPPLHVFASGALSRYRRKLRKNGHELAGLDDEARHEVRKDAKKLRYAVDFFAPVYSGKKAARHHALFLDSLDKLQERLGLLNDLAAAPQLLDRLGLADHRDAAALLGHSKRKPLLRRAAKAMDGMAAAGKFWP